MSFNNHKTDPLEPLALADPNLAERVRAVLEHKEPTVSDQPIKLLVEEALWGLSIEISFGRTIAFRLADLIGRASPQQIECYRSLVRKFGSEGPTLGRIMAEHLVPVLEHGDARFLKRFLKTLDIMQLKGTYTLPDPLKTLSELLHKKDIESASVYIDLLGEAFAGDMSYVQSQHFAHILPKAVLAFSPSKRVWQMEQLRRIITADFHLADFFLDGLEKGLHLLSKDALDRFVSLALDKLQHNPRLAAKFLSLESKLGMDTYADLQVTVPLSEVQNQLNGYLCARTGLSISVRPLSSLSRSSIPDKGEKIFVCSDGKFIYLPDEIGEFNQKSENIKLYKCLVRLEAGLYEFNTFDFDLEKAMERCPGIGELTARDLGLDSMGNLKSKIQNRENLSDMERFFSAFQIPALARDLFTIFEHGRTRVLLSRQYPGLIRQTMPMLRENAARILKEKQPVGFLFLMYLWIALDISVNENFESTGGIKRPAENMVDLFNRKIKKDPSVEICAQLVSETYPDVEKRLNPHEPPQNYEKFYESMPIPFGRRLRPDLFFSTYRNFEHIAAKLKVQLDNQMLKVYKSDIRRQLIAKNGAVSHEDIKSIIRCDQNAGRSVFGQSETPVDLSWLDLAQLLGSTTVTPFINDGVVGPVFWYKEWDCNLNDYLSAHVRILDRFIPEFEGDFYLRTLKRHQGLVKSIRHAFELLKPEGLVRLRQWVEGDEFDYRALLDFAIDKKAGKTPSDRLYIKRLKQTRDVAVLLLVDLSRSTSHAIYNSKATILDVEKEAIVLFCEALQVVGDAFAIAGFSSTGRLGVDYMRIKDFEENMNDRVKCRINAMAPQRNTRMGAAIRHAYRQLEKADSKVRLLIILGDGFPNDVGYKHHYAIEDTRKAIFEGRSKNIFTHAITVHFAGDPKLDDLYGNVHHNVISDVRELPDKLLHIYGSLTRH
jgi:nitric oxide reductase NorD protein